MERASVRPSVFISASSVGAYGFRGYSDVEMTEDSPPGDDFWGQDSLAWERAALEAERLGVRVVTPRTGYVLSAQAGGGLAGQVAQFRRGYGGPVAPGKQWSPWVHIADVAGVLLLALDNPGVSGPLNVTSPGAVRNRVFAETLGSVVGKPARFPVPQIAIWFALGIAADTITHARHVVPAKALALGYQFQYPALEGALRDLVAHISA